MFLVWAIDKAISYSSASFTGLGAVHTPVPKFINNIPDCTQNKFLKVCAPVPGVWGTFSSDESHGSKSLCRAGLRDRMAIHTSMRQQGWIQEVRLVSKWLAPMLEGLALVC